MPPEQILAELTDLFRDVFERPDLTLTRQTTAQDVEGWDSVNHINVIVAAEMHFGVKFKTAELDEMKNVGELVDLIGQKMKR
jgi:acyl carrier protein